MKKYLKLAVVTLLLVGFATQIPTVAMWGVPTVSLAQLQVKEYTETVKSSGTIEELNKKELLLEMPVVPDEVYVSVGDTVSIGDVIAKVNVPQTVTAMASLQNSFSDLSSSSEIANAWLGGKTISADSIPQQIVANASGTITSISLQQGTLAGVSKSVCTISDPSQVRARVAVDEADIAKISAGQTATITGKALGEKSYQGVVSQIEPTATTQLDGLSYETVVYVLLDLKEPDEAIKAGYHVTAKITTADTERRYFLPYRCVDQAEDGSEFVYCYQDGKAVRCQVQTGVESSNNVEIVSGISVTDMVIDPISAIPKDQSRVKIKAK